MEPSVYPAPVPGLESCWEVISRDPVRYLDLTEAVARGDGVLVDVCPTGALARLHTYDLPGQEPGYSMFAQDLPTARRMLAQLPAGVDYIIIHEDHYIPLIQERFHLDAGKPAYQTAYLKADIALPQAPFDVRALSMTHLPLVLANYHLETPDYLEYLVKTGEFLGAFEGDTLVGFMGRHAEGAMGLLEVLPPYRRRGIGRLLESHMIRRELALGHVPYGQVFSDNAPSLALQRDMGLTLSQETLRWMLVL